MSDSNMNARGGIVIGTAGHIDHGKTSLVGALTGIDTDRLAEEKKRGISIDLGFARLTLPSGERVSFIDVPGHERFIKNMLAGAIGIEAVLLVIAADEGVKPQTVEHFDICKLLGIERGVVVLSKCDLATDEQISTTFAAIKQLTAGSFLEAASVVAVSCVTRQGIHELVAAIEQLSVNQTKRDARGFARLPLDRSFALKGFGTVLTGTLWSGALRIGDTVEIQPTAQRGRIRGLQVHGTAVREAFAGQRIAVNLSGIEHLDIKRGFVLAHPSGLETTRLIHGSVHWLCDVPPLNRKEDFLLYIGTSEIPVRVRMLKAKADNGLSLVQLNLLQPVLALSLDRFILRRPSPSRTIGGGLVIDAFPSMRLGRAKAAERLERLLTADLTRRLEILVEEKQNGCLISELMVHCGTTLEEIKASALASSCLLVIEPAQRLVDRNWLTQKRKSLARWLRAFHEANPSMVGAPLSQARLGLDPALSHFVFFGFSDVRVEGDIVALASYQPQVSTQDAVALHDIEQVFRQGGYQPPTPIGLPRSLLEKLIKSGRLIRVSEDLIFHTEVITHIQKSLAAHKGRRFSVPEFKNWTQISRKYAIPLLEFLDHQRVTRRDGDARIVL